MQCEDRINAEITYDNGTPDIAQYSISADKKPKLEISPYTVVFNDVVASEEKTIAITARNADVEIDGTTLDNTKFVVTDWGGSIIIPPNN